MNGTENAANPAVRMEVNADGTAAVTVDGVRYQIVAGTPEDARTEALGYIAATVAAPTGTAVLVQVIHQGDPSMILINPDGSVESVGQPVDTVPSTPPDVRPTADSQAPVPLVPQGAPAHWLPPQPGFGQPDSAPQPGFRQLSSAPQPGFGQPNPAPPFEADQRTPVETSPVAETTPTYWTGSARHAAPHTGHESPLPHPGGDRWSALGQADVTGPIATGPGSEWSSAAGTVGTGTHAHDLPEPAPEDYLAAGVQAPAWQPPPSPATPPSLEDLLASRPAPAPGPAQQGFRAFIRRVSGGLINPAPNAQELAHRSAVQAVQRSLNGPKTVVVLNTKGGGGKTTATYCLAASFGTLRGGYVLAWDNNETRGTLAWRASPSRHTNTAVTLLRDLNRFEDVAAARVGDLDNYVRGQGNAQFDVLASDEDAASETSIDAAAFRTMHASLARFYRILVVDTGNNTKASNWQAAVDAADQLVIVSSIREDTAGGASWTLDSLMQSGRQDKVASAVTVLSSPSKVPDAALVARLEDHFRRRTRAVLHVPYDPALVDGGPILMESLSSATWEAWLRVAAAIADNL